MLRKLPKDLPTVAKALQVRCRTNAPYPATLFTNALVIPQGYGSAGFQIEQAPKPKWRATNNGLVFVTIEYDCETPEQLESLMAWTRNIGNSGPAFAEVDREFCRLKDYRGYCVIFTGNRSLQFHLVFSTSHLRNLPVDIFAEIRLRKHRQDAALIANIHETYWDHAQDVFERILRPELSPDPKLRSVVQWRRTPWGIRRLEKDSTVLGIPAGTEIPQIVIAEKIRQRAPKTANEFLVHNDFSLAHPVPKPRQKASRPAINIQSNQAEVITVLQAECGAEWGEYPKPVSMEIQDGDRLIRFRNHPNDKKPSTIVLGEYRQLQISGKNDFGDREFFLPEGMTANEMGEYVAVRCGLESNPVIVIEPTQIFTPRNPTEFERLYCEPIEKAFVEPITELPLPELAKRYREKLRTILTQRRDHGQNNIVVSVEGIAKTSAHLPILAEEAFQDALNHNDGIQRFAAFAFRSRTQVAAKAAEFRQQGYSVKVVSTFWDRYDQACQAANLQPIARDDIDESSPGDILDRIRVEQPAAFSLLEKARKTLWAGAPFDSGRTILALTQRAAALWPTSVLTRAWHHPEFDPHDSNDSHKALRDKFQIARVVYDDPEPDEFLHLLSRATWEYFRALQGRYKNWRNRSRQERVEIFRQLRNKGQCGSERNGFDDFDTMMRSDLDRLELIRVDYTKIKFGHDAEERGIYGGRHGEEYYIGPREWVFNTTARNTFLTTETLGADIICEAFSNPYRLNLTNVPGIYPLKIPTYLDRRAGADRKDKKRVSVLAQEIIAANPNAIVVSDGVENMDGVKTFQSMKGLNGLEEKDLYIIVTCIAPEKFAELNVIGQWIGNRAVVQDYYQDQVNQAVGRNRGFRESRTRRTNTVVIASPRLWNSVLSKVQDRAPRVQLYVTNERPW
jgi:hypothetical protein